MIILDVKACKKIILFFFFVFMCGVMAHKRGYGFDAVFCRLSFVAFVGVFLLLTINNTSFLKTHTKSFFVGMLLFAFFYFVSVLWAKNTDVWGDSGISNSLIQILGTVFIIEATADNLDDCKAYLKAYLLAVVYMMLWLLVATPVTAWGTERVGKAIGLNANSVGIRCAVSFIISMYFAGEKGGHNKLYLISAAMAAYIALFSGSRKAFLILLIGFSLFWCGKTRGWKILIRLVLITAAAIGVIYLVMTHDGLYQVLGRRLESAFYHLIGEGRGDMSSREREFYRNYAWLMFMKHPLLGYGGNGFVGEMRRINYSHVAYSHCNYTELLATLGVVGFFLYYRIQGKMLTVTIKNYTSCHDNERGAVSFVLTLVLTHLIAEYYMVSYYSVDKQIILAILFMFIHCYNIESEALA